MGVEWLALIMFAVFLVLLLVGYPVAFSFAGTAIVFGAVGILLGEFDFNRLIILFSRWFKAVDNFTLLAVPFFVFMGAILQRSGLAERMLTTIGMALGRLKGGLGLTVVVVGAMLAAATGVVAATVIVMGPPVPPDHGPLRVRPPARYRPHHGVRDPRPASPTVPGANPPGPGGGRIGRRPVPRGHGSGHHVGRYIRCLLPIQGLYEGRCSPRPS